MWRHQLDRLNLPHTHPPYGYQKRGIEFKDALAGCRFSVGFTRGVIGLKRQVKNRSRGSSMASSREATAQNPFWFRDKCFSFMRMESHKYSVQLHQQHTLTFNACAAWRGAAVAQLPQAKQKPTSRCDGASITC